MIHENQLQLATAAERRALDTNAGSDGAEPKVDPLRERLAAPELAEARTKLREEGLAGLVDHASRALAKAEEARARFEILSREVERHPAKRFEAIEAYLRETVVERRALKGDLRALAKARKSNGRDGIFDLPALGERAARLVALHERATEATLALVKETLESGANEATSPEKLDPEVVSGMARASGSWSRRCEALAVLTAYVRARRASAHESLVALANELATRNEHRWVQPAALALLGAIDRKAALSLADEKLSDRDGADAFLVRERIVDLVARGAIGGDAWEALAAKIAGDPSEHVRITVARGETDPARLASMAMKDRSAKVRAMALITLAARDGHGAEGALVRALVEDSEPLPVVTAAEELAVRTRVHGLERRSEVLAQLARAAERDDLPELARVKVADALLETSVVSDYVLRAAHDALAKVVEATVVGGRTQILDPLLTELDDVQLGRVLAVLSRNDFGLAVDRIPGGVVLHRGERRRAAAWRTVHELLHPSPSKRQAFMHTWGRDLDGALRAPPGGLAELTATRVPGERVMIDHAGGWGRHLPLVDDLLSTGVVRGETVRIVGATGITTVRPPVTFGARLRAWATLTFRYADLAARRVRSLESDEPSTQASFVNEVMRATGITIAFSPHVFSTGDARILGGTPRGLESRSVSTSLVPIAAVPRFSDQRPRLAPRDSKEIAMHAYMPAILAPFIAKYGPQLGDTFRSFVDYAKTTHGNRLPHLTAYACIMLGAMLVRGAAIRHAIQSDRDAIPLVIGGWGTRGKSGTERLKAALFQGLGHEALVKTTGCEAMFIHAIPGVPAREVFLHRPYDKATVWEQRDVLTLARQLGARVFLWECMALQPDLVNLLQSQWMRDDYSTITNAYPDHEDVQGPSGYDVANVISEFVPTNGSLITTEEQMLPILRERAKERGTKLRVVAPREAELLADDLLARFPYQEHPKNVALVTSLARALGVPASVAIAEMADHVVPDLGVLKTYPATPHRGRTLSFVNGMSANERTGALGNWTRVGLDAHDPEADPRSWIVTLVNNRADRVARSEVFARFLVEDIGAHAHVLIGTNVGGLRGFIREALADHLRTISPIRDLDGDGTDRLRTVRARIERAFSRLKVARGDVASVAKELEAFELPIPSAPAIESMLTPESPDESYDAALVAVDRALSKDFPSDSRPFVVASIARRRVVRAIHAVVGRDLGNDPVRLERAFSDAYRAIFEASIIALEDPSLTGDQILDAIARHVPPHAKATIMGVQNIKGTGLDFVYRWVSIDAVHGALGRLRAPRREVREAALRELLVHGDYGLLDASLALDRVHSARTRDPEADALPYDAVLARLATIVEAKEKRLRTTRGRSFGDSVRAAIGRALDSWDARRRRHMATRLTADLVLGRISRSTAARRMREIVARTKGAWMIPQES